MGLLGAIYKVIEYKHMRTGTTAKYFGLFRNQKIESNQRVEKYHPRKRQSNRKYTQVIKKDTYVNNAKLKSQY